MNKDKEDLKSLKVDLSTNGGNTQQKDNVQALEVIANLKAKEEAKKRMESNMAAGGAQSGKSFTIDTSGETSEFDDGDFCDKAEEEGVQDEQNEQNEQGRQIIKSNRALQPETEEGMTDETAKIKISGAVGMLLILSLLPELSKYSHEDLAAKVIGGVCKDDIEEKITFEETETPLLASKRTNMDIHAVLSGFDFSTRGFSISFGKAHYGVPRSTRVETGLFIHMDIEPQSSILDMNTYIKRAAYYLASIRVRALSTGVGQEKPPDYDRSTKAHSIWLSKVSLSFVGETGVYHTAVYGGNLNVYSLDHKDLNDMNLEEIFIIDLNKAAAYYNSKKEILKGTRAETLSIFSEYMLTQLHEESIRRIEDIYKVKVEIVEGGEIIMESIERRWITKRDAEDAKKDAEIAKKDAEIAKILAIINKENPILAAEIKAEIAGAGK